MQRGEIEAFERRILGIFAAAGITPLLLGAAACGPRAGDDGDTHAAEDGDDGGTHHDDTAGGETTTGGASSGAATSTSGDTTAAVSDSSSGAEAASSGGSSSETGEPLCTCADDEVCLVTCDGTGWATGAECIPITAECNACTPECEEILCGEGGLYSCQNGYCEGGGDIHCQGLGRPYVVDGTTAIASLAERNDWLPARPMIPGAIDDARAAEHAEQALAEHASIASFAQLVLDLLALGAPGHLVSAASLAMVDEVEHARLAFALASAHAGRSLGPGPLVPRTSRPPTKIELACETAIAAVMETVGAFAQRAAAVAELDPERAREHHRVADDELRHAELAWRIVAWAIDGDHAARAAVADALAGVRCPLSRSSGVDVDALARLLRRTTAALA